MRRICAHYVPLRVVLSSPTAAAAGLAAVSRVSLGGGARGSGNGNGAIVSSPMQRRAFTTTRLLWASTPQPLLNPADASSTAAPPSTTSVAPLPEASPQEKAEEDAIAEKLRALSPEDQHLIMNALQHPESQKESRLGGAGIGTKQGDMVAAFTCGKCDFRMVKRFSKHAYTKGIVIVECPNCEVRHLLADNLGWFVDESRNIEEILKDKGESFVRIGSDLQVEPPSQ